MANATINVTACDNELYLIAVNQVSGASPSESYQLVHIQSGNNESVNVTATVSPGTYSEPLTYNGVNNALNASYTVSLPSGTYNLLPIGIDWGVDQNFAFTLTSGNPPTTTPFSLPLTTNSGDPQVVWTPSTQSGVAGLSFTIS